MENSSNISQTTKTIINISKDINISYNYICINNTSKLVVNEL